MIEKLIEIGKQLLVEKDIHRILRFAIDAAIETTHAERGLVILFGEGGEILFEVARNFKKEDIQNPKFEISRTIIQKVKAEGQPFCINNALEDGKFKKSKSSLRLNLLSVICLPLKRAGTVFGVVYLDNRAVAGVFKPEARQFATAFADFISLAAYNSLEAKISPHKMSQVEQELRRQYHFEAIIGHSPAIINILKRIAQVAHSDATVLIHGENGTGKEIVAHALHYNSLRKNKPFVPINCGALPEPLMESELFGHVRGAYTGAIKDKIGWFERASGGTIFLDEISEMKPAMQIKLLRVLQTGEYSPVGSTEIRKCDVRVIAATHQDLAALVRESKFREDVYYRLNVIDFEIPPLRERKSDIPPLVEHFLKIHNSIYPMKPKHLSAEAEALLLMHDYPGNVRELENAIQRAMVLSENELIEPFHLPTAIYSSRNLSMRLKSHSTLTEAKQQAVSRTEKEFILFALKATRGNITRAAQMAGLDPSNFHKLMKKHHINPAEFKKDPPKW